LKIQIWGEKGGRRTIERVNVTKIYFREGGGGGWRGEMAQTMYAHVNK
jgi:hypothetical protein